MDPRTLVVLSILVVSFQGITCQSPSVIETYLAYRDTCREKLDNLPYPSTGKKGIPHCNRTWDGIACWEDWPAGELAHQPCPSYLFPAGLKAEATRQCMPDGSWQLFELLEDGKLINNTQTNWTGCSLASDDQDHEAEEHFYQTLNVIRIIYKIGYSLSLVALIIAMAIFLYFRKLWVPRNILHMNLFMSLMFRAIIVFIRDAIQDQNYIQLSEKQLAETVVTLLNGNGTDTSVSFAGCKTVHTLLQYFSVTNYFWLLVEGVYLFSLIMIKVYSDKKTVKWYILFGWGFPWLFIIPWVIVQVYDKPNDCWDAVWETSYWIILAPVILSICLNFIIFVILLFIIGYKLINTHGGESMRLRKMAKSTMVLIPLFGVYFMVTVGILNNPHSAENPIGPLAEFRIAWDLILASFQGLLVAVLYCFLNGEVQQQIKRRWEVHLIHRNIVHESRRLSDTFYSTRGGRGLLQPSTRSPVDTQDIALTTSANGSLPNGTTSNGSLPNGGSVHYKPGVAVAPPPPNNGGSERFPPPQVFDFGEAGADQYDPPPAYDGDGDSEVSSCKEVAEGEEIQQAEAAEEEGDRAGQGEMPDSKKDSGMADVWQHSPKKAPRSSASSSSSKESGISVSWEGGGGGGKRDHQHPSVSFVDQPDLDRVEVVSYESTV